MRMMMLMMKALMEGLLTRSSLEELAGLKTFPVIAQQWLFGDAYTVLHHLLAQLRYYTYKDLE